MLRRVSIRNLTLLPELTVKFDAGLNVLTGETGAGKSILVDAIGLLAGTRSSVDDIREGEKMAMVEGVLEFPLEAAVWKALEDAGVPSESNEIVIRRTVGLDGRSRVYVNDCQWTVSSLARFSRYWIDICGQHGQQELLDEKTHFQWLDTFGRLDGLADEYQEAFRKVQALDRELKDFRKTRERVAKEKDFLIFQYRELCEANLVLGEEEELRSLHQRMANAEKLACSFETMKELVKGESGVQVLWGRLAQEITAASRLDSSLSSWRDDVDAVNSGLETLQERIEKYQQNLDFDPVKVEAINERLAKLQSLARKYGSIQEAIEERDRIQKILAEFESPKDREGELEKGRKQAAQKLSRLGTKLSDQRKKAAQDFSKRISQELKSLGLSQAKFSIEFMEVLPNENHVQVGQRFFSSDGAESVSFVFAPNPGEGFHPLASIASGGELSRVLLAIKGIAMADGGEGSTTFLFDEVDAGIGGETAERVGIRLVSIAQGRQVLCVTHLAQIACYANAHLQVSKRVQAGRTVAEVEMLSPKGRKKELARMMGGISITERTLDHAGELLRRGSHSQKGF